MKFNIRLKKKLLLDFNLLIYNNYQGGVYFEFPLEILIFQNEIFRFH